MGIACCDRHLDSRAHSQCIISYTVQWVYVPPSRRPTTYYYHLIQGRYRAYFAGADSLLRGVSLVFHYQNEIASKSEE